MIAQQFRDLAQDEQGLVKQKTPSNAVAVFPLTYDGTDEKFSALGLGLAEMMTSDLGQVKKLKMVERLRVDELLSELKFSASAAVDPSSAPRMGKFLSAGKIVGGRYSIGGDNNLRVDIATLDIARDSVPKSTTENDALDNLFKLQKEVVFKLVKDMGITLTREEVEAIQRVPTRNLQAFLAYSKGLEKEGQGDFEAAGVYYKQAGTIDPGFTPAKSKAVTADAIAAAGPSKETALAAATKVSPGPAPDTERERRGDKQHLMNQRLTKLTKLISLGFLPGMDDRKPAQQASDIGAAFSTLPDPPPPPPKP
jgi:TolB-like protein